MVNLSIYRDLAYKVVGAAMRVHRELDWGLVEAIYQEALAMELADCGIESEAEKEVPVYYRKRLMQKKYRMDLVVGDIVCELKAVSEIIPAHRAQLCNYLRLTRKPLGLLINFGAESLQGERWAFDELTNQCYLVDVNMKLIPMDDDLFDIDD